MDFVAIDVETANQDPASICQVGLAAFSQGKFFRMWSSLVNPQDSFTAFNIQIHGIQPADVAHAPTWLEVQSEVRQRLEPYLLASHTYFDRRAVNGANTRYGLKPFVPQGWLDTCQIARIAWPHLPNHKLPSLARAFGIVYGAHDAAEDARCAGEILLLAARHTGLSLYELSKGKRGF